MPRSAERSSRVDLVSLLSGIGVTALGTLLLLDQIDGVELTFGWLGAIVAAIVGTALLVSGLRDPGPEPGPPPPSAPRASGE